MRFFSAIFLTLFFSQFSTYAYAHIGVKYQCVRGDETIEVEFFADENRAQVIRQEVTFGVVYNDKDGYLNVFKQAQFYPNGSKPLLYMGMKQYDCAPKPVPQI